MLYNFQFQHHIKGNTMTICYAAKEAGGELELYDMTRENPN